MLNEFTIIIIKCCCLARTTHRRSMGLPPAQGHNNLRLNTTTNYYPKYRLDTTQYNNTRKPKQSFYTNPLHPSVSSSARQYCSYLRNPTRERRPSYRSNEWFAETASIDLNRRFDYDFRTSNRLRTLSPTCDSIRLRKPARHRSIKSKHSIASQKVGKYFSSKDEQQNSCNYTDHSNANDRNIMPSNVNAPIVSNMPLMNVNSSIFLVNHSPFGLRDPRFGIFHHCSQSISYFWILTQY